MVKDKYNITYYTDFLLKLKREYNSSNDVCDTFNIGIKSYIDDIEANAGSYSDSQWATVARVAKSNVPDGKHLAIYMIQNTTCPIRIIRDFEDTTTDNDILLACLAKEMDAKRIEYVISSIDVEKLKRIGHRSEIRMERPPFTQEVINILATEFAEKFDDRYLLFVTDKERVEKMIDDNGGLTERQSSYILQNPYLGQQFKNKIYGEYGYNVDMLNEHIPNNILNDIFESVFQTAFEVENIDTNTKTHAENIIWKMQEKKLLTDYAQSKLINACKSIKILSQPIVSSLKDIALTTNSFIALGLIDHPLKYRNKSISSSSLSIALLEGLETMSTALTDRAYGETANFLADKIIYQNKLPATTIQSLYDDLKLADKHKKELQVSIALSVVSNTNIDKSTRNKFAKLYKKNEYIASVNTLHNELEENEFTEEEIKYVLESVLQKNNYIEKNIEDRKPAGYIGDKKFEILENIIKNLSTSVESETALNLRRCLSIVGFERHPVRLYKENKRLFAPMSDYDLSAYDKDKKTIHILKLDRKTNEELEEIYKKMSLNELKVYKNIIYSAVSNQPNKYNLYLWLDKYVRQFNIVDNIMQEKIKENEIENKKTVEKLTEIFDR